MPYVNHRWLGGLLTNWRTMSDRIERLHELRRLRDEGQMELLPAKERISMARRAREARGEPRRRRRHAPPARRHLHHRPEEGAARRARGTAARAAGRRARRHELRPGRGGLRHPGQRRRDPLVRADHARDRRRDQRPASRRSSARSSPSTENGAAGVGRSRACRKAAEPAAEAARPAAEAPADVAEAEPAAADAGGCRRRRCRTDGRDLRSTRQGAPRRARARG